jgi:tripartite-type tricarboxylate transporter receptor subunit TctC
MKRRFLAAAIAGITCWALAPSAIAQGAFPNRPLTIVVPFGAGAGSDVGARLLAQKLSESLGQPVVVENKPGANGAIAAELVAKARPDGHTLLIGTNSTHGANPALIKQMRYDPIKDFEPVNRVAIFTSIIVAGPGAPVKTMRELIDYGKTHEVSLATGNASGIVQSETLARQVGWKQLFRVPFKSNPQAMTEVVAGRVQLMFSDIAAALGQVKAGNLRPLAATSKQRSALMPDVPTIEESGVPDYDLSGWISLFAPAGTPRAVVEKLNAEVTKAMESPDLKKRFLEFGAEPAPMRTAEFGPWVQQEVSKWTRLVREAGIQPE